MNDKTLRDEFALASMNGLQSHWFCGLLHSTWVAEYAYRQADAMLKARETKPND